MKAALRKVCRPVGDPIWRRNDDALPEPASIPCDQTGSCRRSLRKAKPSHEMAVIVFPPGERLTCRARARIDAMQARHFGTSYGRSRQPDDRRQRHSRSHDVCARPTSPFLLQRTGNPQALSYRACHPIDSGRDRNGIGPQLFKRGSSYYRQESLCDTE